MLQALFGENEIHEQTVKFVISHLSQISKLNKDENIKKKNNYWIDYKDHHFALLGCDENLNGVFLDSLPNCSILADIKNEFKKKCGNIFEIDSFPNNCSVYTILYF